MIHLPQMEQHQLVLIPPCPHMVGTRGDRFAQKNANIL